MALTDIDGQRLGDSVAPKLSNRNKIINGDMRIDQRNAGAAVSPMSGAYAIDRWTGSYLGGGVGRFSAQQSSTAPSGFTKSWLITVTTDDSAPSSTHGYNVHQAIEGYNIADLGFGTASASSIAVSFWVRSSVTGTFPLIVYNGAGTRAYGATYTISSADTFEYKTISIAGDTTGTWATDNTAGLYLIFGFGGGSGRTLSTGWQAASGSMPTNVTGSTSLIATNGATFYITGVQLEAGNTATPFEHRSLGDELNLCERYFQKSYELDTAVGAIIRKGAVGLVCANGSNGEQSQIRFSTRLRASPTFKFYNFVTGAVDSIRNVTSNTNGGAAYNEISQAGFTGGPTSPVDGNLFFYHYTAEAEL